MFLTINIHSGAVHCPEAKYYGLYCILYFLELKMCKKIITITNSIKVICNYEKHLMEVDEIVRQQHVKHSSAFVLTCAP